MSARPLSVEKRRALHTGIAIPAHPLALDGHRRFDERHQRALTRYYLAAGARGLAVGVHTTQFGIRDAHVGLLEPVLALAAETVAASAAPHSFVSVAGIVGPTAQAVREAELAVRLGYDLGLVSMGGLEGWSDDQLIARVQAIAEVIPVFAFYLQPAVGGRVLGYNFWRRVAELEGVEAIKIAPFDRYETVSVVRAVCESSRIDQVALYTGNDDHIIGDLLASVPFARDDAHPHKRIVGGLLGQFAVWTQVAVRLHRQARDLHASYEGVTAAGGVDASGEAGLSLSGTSGDARFAAQGGAHALAVLLRLATEWTDANGAIFDANHRFRGSIAGIQEVLYRQGLVASPLCLDPQEGLSPGQREEIDRVCASYPHLQDAAFVRAHLDEWLH